MRTIVFSAVLLASLASAQTSAIEQGRAMYRSNCAFCHGLTGLGGRGPDLVSGNPKSDEETKRIVKQGVPGSTMPAFSDMEDSELNKLVAFLKHLAGSTTLQQKPTGDPGKGRKIYARSGCAGCHQIDNEGSTYGPELTRIGGARALKYLEESLTEPSADIPSNFEGVSVIGADGRKVTGIRVNEDTFSVQLRLPNERYRSFIKADARQVIYEKNSLMPAYKQLSRADLDDLLAYLASLKARADQAGRVKEAEGIR
jgi:cytochrome c oxidase cbb3-type subunit 3